MRIVSDFDGVLTDQTVEADRAFALFMEAMESETSLSAAEVEAVVAEARQALNDAPQNYGWTSGTRLSAYANEDLFVRSIGIALYLDRLLPHMVFATPSVNCFQDLSGVAYRQMVDETSRGVHKPFDPRAAALLRALLRAGHEVTVVSNSATDRVVELLRDADVPVAPVEGVRARGDARKFILSDDSKAHDAIEVGGYACAVDRPHYRAILLEERPDVVIGDVFSLDLALPIALGRSGDIGEHGFTAVLRRRPYTPEWSQSFISSAEVQFKVIDDIMDILSICARNG